MLTLSIIYPAGPGLYSRVTFLGCVTVPGWVGVFLWYMWPPNPLYLLIYSQSWGVVCLSWCVLGDNCHFGDSVSLPGLREAVSFLQILPCRAYHVDSNPHILSFPFSPCDPSKTLPGWLWGLSKEQPNPSHQWIQNETLGGNIWGWLTLLFLPAKRKWVLILKHEFPLETVSLNEHLKLQIVFFFFWDCTEPYCSNILIFITTSNI